METIVFLIEQIAPGLFILSGLVVLWGLRALLSARHALSTAQFELEKELQRYRANNWLTVILIAIELGLAVVAVTYIVAPTLRAQPPVFAADTTAPIETPFVTALPAAGSGTPLPDFAAGATIPALEDELGLRPFATPTLTPTPVGTIIPDVPPVRGCDSPNAQLVIPANGMVIFEATNIIGTATTENFSFYRFVLNGPSTLNVPAIFGDHTVPVIAGELGQIVPSLLTPGEHRFSMLVYDINNTQQASCEVTIIISEPIPTATPLRES